MYERTLPSSGASTSHDDEDGLALTDSTIFAISSLVGSTVLEQPSLDIGATRMDESQLRLAASVFSNTRDGIMIADAGGNILDINRAFSRITGYSRDEVVGRQSDMLRSDAHPPEFYEEIAQSLATRGYWRGEVWSRRKNGDKSVELLSVSAVQDAFGKLTHYVSIFTDISDLKESQRRLEHLAYHDALTHLPNRTLLADRILRAMASVSRHKSVLAVCFLDLDDFKPVNDKYGHQMGDRLLVEVARRLEETVRAGDTVARLGGDEFALLLSDLSGPDDASEALCRILAAVGTPYIMHGEPIKISASIGYTLFPSDDSDSDSLLRHADQAMYVAKLSGPNCFHLFDAEQDQRVRSHRESIVRMGRALLLGEFRLVYQPKVNMRNGRVVGAEALIRWQHPERGFLAPADFLIPLGDHAIQADIGDWVIGEAMRQMNVWLSAGLRLPVSVNIAGSHLQHPEFKNRLVRHLAAYPNVPASALELEILETTALEDITQVSRIIESCAELGVNFSVDDFGTGYSSLVYLKRLPAKILKIDRSFIRDMLDDSEDLAIVSGILGLASAFGREAVAEGIETIEHGILLLRLGCEIGQGYGIARPMAADALPAWTTGFVSPLAWQESQDLHWQTEDFPLLVADLEQERWLNEIIASMSGDESLHLESGQGHLQEGRFGRWLFGRARECYGSLSQLKVVEQSYRQVYRLGAEIKVRLARSRRERLEELLVMLREKNAVLIEELRYLRGEIIGPNSI